ncbi:MAG: signal recognition particle-docking protein FtsY [Candidatus Nanohaloarchaeota archaeon]|nr:signal recognition particle-docking protein FtsY [Candidatus Nanohaloarchaeota archaeon]
MFSKFRKLINKTSKKIAEKVTTKEIKEEDIEDILWEMQFELIENNVSLEVAENIIQNIKSKLVGKIIDKKEKIENIIKEALIEEIKNTVIEKDFDEMIKNIKEKPKIIVFFGFNGTGKTTTIAKLAHYLLKKGKSVVLAAGDTFRAAAIEQLQEHASKLGVKLIKQQYGSDSAAVIYDAVNYAKSKGIEFVLADTAGRAPTDKNLLEELSKIVRVIKPHLRILVLESITGNDIVEQAKLFNEVGVDAVIITKYDVDDKKGAVLSVSYAIKKPIIFLGTGQNYEDLKKFSLESYIQEILK